MPGIRWGKSSGKNRGGTCNGGEGRKCERADSKDALRSKERECIKKRGFLHGGCMKSSVADDALIEIKSTPSESKGKPNRNGTPCEIKGKAYPNSNILPKGTVKRIDACRKSLDISTIKINSKSSFYGKCLHGLGVFDTCERGVDEECNKRLDDGNFKCKGSLDVEKGMRDNECIEGVKQSRWGDGCMEDMTQGKRNGECMEDAKQGRQDNKYMKQGILDMEQGIFSNGHMLRMGLNPTSVMKEKKSDEGGDAKCTDSSSNGKDVNDGSCKVCNAGVEEKDNLYEKSLGTDSELVMLPHDFVCRISKKVMEDPVVVASGLTFERANIQAWLEEGNTLCPITRKPLSHLELIPNLNLKALISSWYSQSQNLDFESAHHSFSTCVSSLSSCLMTSHSQSFVSCSSFSVSKLLEETELYSPSSTLSSSVPELLTGAELHSCSLSSISLSSYDTPKHLRAGGIHNFPYTSSSTGSPSSIWGQEREELTLQENTLQSVKLMCKKKGEDEMAMPKASERCNLQSKSMDSVSQSANLCSYIVSRIDSLVADLQSKYVDIQRTAAAELRLLAKHDDGKRLMIARAGGLRPLVALIWSRDQTIQLEATTALLNLSLNHSLKNDIVKEGAIEALVWVLRDGCNTITKENAAIMLACLASSEENKIRIGMANAVKPLVNLLKGGSLRGKKDAAAALYRLSSNDENKRRIVRAGASRPLVGFMSNEGDKNGMVDKAMAILGNLVSIEEGKVSFIEEKGILSLMQVLQTGSDRSKGLAISILSQLCVHSSKHRSLVLQKEPLPTLMVLSKTGNTRFKTRVAEVIQNLIVDAD